MSSDRFDLDAFMDRVKARNPGEDEFHQAVHEVAESLKETLDAVPEYRAARIFDRLTEPDQLVSFRVEWEGDDGQIRINRGYRVQMSNAIGPYKGGIRFHPSVSESVLKFLAFEQVFKNALTDLPMGAGKGGADFDPKGCSEAEIMRFCRAFMTQLHHHIGPDVDIPAGDIGVGPREIGFMFGAYKRITGRFAGVITGKSMEYGGSAMRPEATGYGLLYFVREMLKAHDRDIDKANVAISGAGNVALHAAEKAIEMGARVVTLSDSNGFIHDLDGLDQDKIDWIREHKRTPGASLEAYAERFGADWHEGEKPWSVACSIALPCATENEIDEDAAKLLAGNGVYAVGEGANMPCTEAAIRVWRDNEILFAPGKAANAGGVALSGLEISQNQLRRSLNPEELAETLESIMRDIHRKCCEYGENGGKVRDYVQGANVAGFRKVADAMLAFGVG